MDNASRDAGIKDKGKKIAQQIDEEDEIYLKRDRFENEGIAEPSEEAAKIFVKKARIEPPLGIPFYHASMGGLCNQACSRRGWRSHIGKGTCGGSGELPDTESLRDRINFIAKLHGLNGVPLEAAAVLNSGLDEYIKRIIRPCINLVQPVSYQFRMQDSEGSMQMNNQWLEQLGDMSSPTSTTLNEFFPNPATIVPNADSGSRGHIGIDLNQEPISWPNSWSPSSGGTDGTKIDLNLSLKIDIDLNLSPDAGPVSPTGSVAGNIPDYLARIGSGAATSTGENIPGNLACAGCGSDTDIGTGSIFFIGSPEPDNTEFIANQMESFIGSSGAINTGRNVHANLPYAGQGADTDTGSGSIFFFRSPEQSNNESIENEMEWNIGSDDSSTGRDIFENLASTGGNADTSTGTDSIFFFGSPEQGNTEFITNQMEWAENVNGIRNTGIDSADALSGSNNLNGPGHIHRTITLRDFQIAMLMNPQVLGTNWPVMLDDLLSRSFEE